MMTLLKAAIQNPKKIYNYFLAEYRVFLSNNSLGFLIREHIREQYDYRITAMKEACRSNGACVECGCKTPDLQYGNLACEGNCYPDMMNKEEWIKYKKKWNLI